MYQSKHGQELDHKRFGVAKMRDVVMLCLEDVCQDVVTAQQAAVLLPKQGLDYSRPSAGEQPQHSSNSAARSAHAHLTPTRHCRPRRLWAARGAALAFGLLFALTT